MSATFMATGPQIRNNKVIPRINSVDVAPTIMHLFGVAPGPDVDGRVLEEIFK